MAEWRNGRMAEWWNGGMAEWRNGGMAEYSITRSASLYETKSHKNGIAMKREMIYN